MVGKGARSTAVLLKLMGVAEGATVIDRQIVDAYKADTISSAEALREKLAHALAQFETLKDKSASGVLERRG